jgi:hypothetical protein
VSRGRSLGALGLVLLLAACGRAPGSSATAPPAPPGVEDLRAEGDARLAELDWPGAVRAYERVVAQDPRDLRSRYRLGVALANLDRAEEAAAAFAWVGDHGPADLEETGLARRWLAEAGLRAPAAAPRGRDAAPAEREPAGAGLLQGRTEWSRLDPDRPRPPLQILLEGDDPVTRGRRYATRVRLTEPYRIDGVVPGRYRLMAQVGPVRLWDTSVAVRDGGPTSLDLTPAISGASPDALRLLAGGS